MRIARAVAVLVSATVIAGVSLAAPAGAEHCSGKETPPSDYDGRGSRTLVPGTGYTLQYDTGRPMVGTYYSDGYLFVDAADPDGVTVRAFVPFWPEYLDVHLIVGPGAAGSCKHGHGEYPEWFPQPPAPVPTPAPVDV